LLRLPCWSTYRTGTVGDIPTAQNARAAPSPSTPATDRIFAAFDDHAMLHAPRPLAMKIFRDQFRPDEIFNSKEHDG